MYARAWAGRQGQTQGRNAGVQGPCSSLASVLTVYRPRRHGDRHHPQWIITILGAELKSSAQRNCQTDSWPQFYARWLLAVVPSPHLAGAPDDVPLFPPIGEGDGDLLFRQCRG